MTVDRFRMIAFLTLELSIEAAQSLKDKRQVVRSLKDRLRASFNVAVAEIEASDLWNRATIGVVSVSDSKDYLDGLMKNVERAANWCARSAPSIAQQCFAKYVERHAELQTDAGEDRAVLGTSIGVAVGSMVA